MLIAELPLEFYLPYLPCVNGRTKTCICGTPLQRLTVSCVLLKVVVTAAGAARAGTSMDLQFAQSIDLLWKTYPAAVVGRISRYTWNHKSLLGHV